MHFMLREIIGDDFYNLEPKATGCHLPTIGACKKALTQKIGLCFESAPAFRQSAQTFYREYASGPHKASRYQMQRALEDLFRSQWPHECTSEQWEDYGLNLHGATIPSL